MGLLSNSCHELKIQEFRISDFEFRISMMGLWSNFCHELKIQEFRISDFEFRISMMGLWSNFCHELIHRHHVEIRNPKSEILSHSVHGVEKIFSLGINTNPE